MVVKKAFEFVDILEKPRKPRKKGLVEIRGSYYSPVGLTYLKDLLDITQEYVDGFKFAGGSQRLHPVSELKKIIKECHDHNVYVSTGGFVERVAVQGPKAVDKYVEECKSLGFDVIEVSSGFAPFSLNDKVEIVKLVKKAGLKPKPEVSFMKGAGGGTRIAGYKPKLRPVKEVFKEINAYFKAGAKLLMFESEGITEDLPFKQWRTDIIKKVVDEFGLDAWMFEAAEPRVFKWYLQNYGRDVNVFIDHSQVFEYQAWWSKLWGDPSIWKNKKVSYVTPSRQKTTM